MTPNVLIVHPDLALAARLKQLILAGDDATVGFADTFDDGLAVFDDFTYLDLCVSGLPHREDSSRFFALIKERFPRARFLIVNDDPADVPESFEPGILFLTMPQDESGFILICQETFASLHGNLLSHFRLGARFRSDRWSDWYEAYDTVLKREVYVTVVHAWATPEEAERFLSTASLMAQAVHENVLAVFLGGEHEGRSFISHEKWTMPHLAQLAARGQKIDARIAVRILHTVASVLLFWDSNGYPHLPLDATHVSLSPAGVVKVRNCVDPTLPFKPLETDDMTQVANAVQALLPSLAHVPLPVRDLIHKLRAHPQVIFETDLGDIVVDLYNDKAPLTVANFLSYVDRQAYDGTIFHHIIAGFVVQGGRFNQDMTKVLTEQTIPNEASNGLLNLRGTLAMARTNDPHSANSQFIFNLVDNASSMGGVNDHGCTVFGKIVEGLEVIDKMAKVKVTHYDKYHYFPANPITLLRVRRNTSISMSDVVAEAQSLDTHLAVSTQAEVGPQSWVNDPRWVKAMTSTDRALASVSKAILKISTSLLRK